MGGKVAESPPKGIQGVVCVEALGELCSVRDALQYRMVSGAMLTLAWRPEVSWAVTAAQGAQGWRGVRGDAIWPSLLLIVRHRVEG